MSVCLQGRAIWRVPPSSLRFASAGIQQTL
jgi:hypothetical protein